MYLDNLEGGISKDQLIFEHEILGEAISHPKLGLRVNIIQSVAEICCGKKEMETIAQISSLNDPSLGQERLLSDSCHLMVTSAVFSHQNGQNVKIHTKALLRLTIFILYVILYSCQQSINLSLSIHS